MLQSPLQFLNIATTYRELGIDVKIRATRNFKTDPRIPCLFASFFDIHRYNLTQSFQKGKLGSLWILEIQIFI